MTTEKKSDYFFISPPSYVAEGYKIPKAVFLIKRYRNLSGDAKILYGILASSGQFTVVENQKGRCLLYSAAMIRKMMNCSVGRANAVIRELKSAGLLEVGTSDSKKDRLLFVNTMISNIDNDL